MQTFRGTLTSTNPYTPPTQDPEAQALWGKVKSRLMLHFTEAEQRQYLEKLDLVSLRNGVVHLTGPTFTKFWLEQFHKATLLACWKEVDATIQRVELTIRPYTRPGKPRKPPTSDTDKMEEADIRARREAQARLQGIPVFRLGRPEPKRKVATASQSPLLEQDVQTVMQPTEQPAIPQPVEPVVMKPANTLGDTASLELIRQVLQEHFQQDEDIFFPKRGPVTNLQAMGFYFAHKMLSDWSYTRLADAIGWKKRDQVERIVMVTEAKVAKNPKLKETFSALEDTYLTRKLV